MNNNNTLLNSYCFLAALTELNNDLYGGVFVPITKRALSLYNSEKNRSGTDVDIQEYIQEIYGFKIPLTVIRKLLRGVEKSLSKKEKASSGLTVFENGKSFQIEKYTFNELESTYKKGSRNATALNEAFKLYVEEEGTAFEKIPSLEEFLKSHHYSLSNFFNGEIINDRTTIDKTYIHHVTFLEYIEKNNHDLFTVAQQLYLGTVVASFLECDFNFAAKPYKETTYYIDTQIILEALDLQNEADTQPTRELFQLINESGGQLRVLDITLNEILYHIDLALKNFSSQIPTTTINEACLRKGENRTWLTVLKGKLEKVLNKQFNIKKEDIPERLKKEFREHKEVEELQQLRKTKANALHDVSAYLFVRNKREGIVYAYNNAKAWFITANKHLLSFNIERLNRDAVPEITLPDFLASLLWIRKPKKFLGKLKSIGLSELLSITLQEELASKEVINEFSESIKKTDSISEENYEILLSAITYRSARYIEKLIELAQDDPPEFDKEAIKLVEMEKKRKEDIHKTLSKERKEKREISDAKSKLEDKINEIEDRLVESERKRIKTEDKLDSFMDKNEKHKKIATILLCLTIFLVIMYFLTNLPAIWEIAVILGGFGTFGGFVLNLWRALIYRKEE